MTANQPDKPPPLLLAVNIPSTGETITLHLTNATSELPQHWLIGRSKECAIRIADGRVSTHHATIRAEPMANGNNYDAHGRRRYIWMIKDNGSTNGLYQGPIKVGGRGTPCPWILIEDNDSFLIGPIKVKFSFDGQFTEGGDTNPGEITAVPSEIPTDIRPPVTPPSNATVWDLASFVLTGPKDLSNWIWWMFLASLAAATLVLLEWVKSQ